MASNSTEKSYVALLKCQNKDPKTLDWETWIAVNDCKTSVMFTEFIQIKVNFQRHFTARILSIRPNLNYEF